MNPSRYLLSGWSLVISIANVNMPHTQFYPLQVIMYREYSFVSGFFCSVCSFRLIYLVSTSNSTPFAAIWNSML